MVRFLLRMASVLCAVFSVAFSSVSSVAFAQGAAAGAQGLLMERTAQLEKLVEDWNRLRSAGDARGLTRLFHPRDREAAAEFFAEQRPSNERFRLVESRDAAAGRVTLFLARARAGAGPAVAVETLQASLLEGQWVLRIPGGSLTGSLHDSVAPLPRGQDPGTQASGAKPPSSPAPGSGPPETRRFENWMRLCETARVTAAGCFLQATLVNPVDNKPIMIWRVQLLEDRSGASIIFIPPGVTIAPGLSLALSTEQPTRVPFRTCTAEMCELRFRMEADLVESIGRRADVPVRYLNQAGAEVEFSAPMAGFREAAGSVLAGRN